MKSFAAFLFLYFPFVLPAFSQGLSGDDIIKEVNDLFNPESMYSKSKMTVYTASNQTRTFIYDSWAKDFGEKTLIRYVEPRRVKDQATLLLNYADDIWMFFPRTGRVRKLASHAKRQKMEGSDFSYEDMGSGNSFIEDFSAQRLSDDQREDQDCFVVELKRKPGADISYSRVKLWVLKENFIPVYIEYFSDKDATRKVKELYQDDIQTVQDIPTPFHMVMKDVQDHTRTEMAMLEVKYFIDLDDDLFTERGLKK